MKKHPVIVSTCIAPNHQHLPFAPFRDGLCKVLIATDVAARGIHVDDLELVVSFQFPNEIIMSIIVFNSVCLFCSNLTSSMHVVYSYYSNLTSSIHADNLELVLSFNSPMKPS